MPPRKGEAAYLDAGAGAGHRPRRRRGRLQGGAVHARRQAGAALPRGARGAWRGSATTRRCPISRDGGAGAEGDRPAAASQSRRDEPRGNRAAARGVGVAGHHAGERRRAAVARAAGRISARPTRCRRVRLATIAAAGEAAVPFTSGILIGIGETRRERIEALLALRDLHERYGHIQEIIIQNFRAKPGTRMADAPEPRLDDHLWTIAVARLIFGPAMNIQAPPNLMPDALAQTDRGRHQRLGRRVAGDARPRQPGGALAASRRSGAAHRAAGKTAGRAAGDLSGLCAATRRAGSMPKLRTPGAARDRRPGLCARRCRGCAGRRHSAASLAPEPSLAAGEGESSRLRSPAGEGGSRCDDLADILDRAAAGETLAESRHRRACSRRAATTSRRSAAAADRLRREVIGDTVTYVVNRNINYTNICYFRCQFCAFSKGKLSENLRGRPYDLDLDEIARRARGSLGARRHRSLPAGRHPPGLHRRHLSRRLPRR